MVKSDKIKKTKPASKPIASTVPTQANAKTVFDRVLIVDDSLVNLKVLESMLHRIGVKNVIPASSGEKGFDLFRKEKFDLVLTDLWMPNMNGVEFVEKIRAAEKISGQPATLVCAVTADVEAIKPETASKFNGLLLKPLVLQNLTALINSLSVSHFHA